MGAPAVHVPDTAMRPEAVLLLRCARTCLDAASATRLRTLLEHDLDWPWLLHAALQHGVMPLLYRNLCVVGAETVPPAVLAQLKGL